MVVSLNSSQEKSGHVVYCHAIKMELNEQQSLHLSGRLRGSAASRFTDKKSLAAVSMQKHFELPTSNRQTRFQSAASIDW